MLGAARAMRDAVSVLAAEAPERMSLPQLLFFLHAAEADLSGQPSTFTAIREALGSEVGRSVNTTYKVLIEPTKSNPNALGWLMRQTDPSDERMKYLLLTPKGRLVMGKVSEALNVPK